MNIVVASLNPQKVNAVKELLQGYSNFRDAHIEAFEVESIVSEQPMSLEETIQGAIHRAKSGIGNADYCFGIESGVMEVPYSNSGIMALCVCVIYDNVTIHLGISSLFDPTQKIADLIKSGRNMTQATKEAGYTEHEKIGHAEGLISLLTDGRVTRKTYAQEAIRMAMIGVEGK